MVALAIRANTATGIFESVDGTGVVGISAQWTDFPLATRLSANSNFSSSSNAYTPFEASVDGANFVHHANGGLSNAGWWETRVKDPSPGGGFGSHESICSYKCWLDDPMAPDDFMMWGITSTLEFKQTLLNTWAAQNGGGKMHYLHAWNAAGSAAAGSEIVMTIGNGDQDQDTDPDGLYFSLVNAGAGGGWQNDGTNTPLNLVGNHDRKMWLGVMYDFRASSGANRGAHIYTKFEGDAGITKRLFRSIGNNYRSAGSYGDDWNGRGFCGTSAGGNHAYFGYLDNQDGMTGGAAEAFYHYQILAGNGRVVLPF